MRSERKSLVGVDILRTFLCLLLVSSLRVVLFFPGASLVYAFVLLWVACCLINRKCFCKTRGEIFRYFSLRKFCDIKRWGGKGWARALIFNTHFNAGSRLVTYNKCVLYFEHPAGVCNTQTIFTFDLYFTYEVIYRFFAADTHTTLIETFKNFHKLAEIMRYW